MTPSPYLTQNKMEEKEVNNIASAVSRELTRLNKEIAASQNSKDKPNDIFKCPECGGEVAEGIQFCMHCGCELEWEA